MGYELQSMVCNDPSAYQTLYEVYTLLRAPKAKTSQFMYICAYRIESKTLSLYHLHERHAIQSF